MSKTISNQDYKNIKRAATITAATAAAVATGAMSANVHADTVNNNQPQSAQQTNDQAAKQAAVKNAQETVNQDTQDQAKAQADVNNAQTKADQASQAQTDAQQKADQAQANVNNDQKAVDDANATLKNAGQAPSQAEIDQAQTDANNTAAKTGQAQDAVNQAQAKVSDAQKKADQANQTVKDDQSAIADLNTPVDPNAQAKVDADHTAINSQNTTINQAQSDVNNAQTAANNAKSAHDQAVTDQTNKQAAAKSAQDQANTTAKNLKDAQDTLDTLNQQDPVVENHLIVSDEYVNAFKAWQDAVKSGKQADIDKADKALALAGVHNNKLNHFQHSTADAKISVDWQNLTEEQRQELSIFAANLINDVRAAFNMPKTNVSPASVKMAQDIVNEYNAKNWDIFGEHMTDGQNHDIHDINAYADAHHWMISENAYGGVESWVVDKVVNDGFHKNPIQAQTMDSLKQNIYEGMMAFMFDDEGSAFGHTKNAIGTWNPNDHTKFTGVAYDKYGYLHVNEAIVSDPQHAFWDPSKILDDPTDDAARAALKKDAYDLQPSEDKLATQKKAAQDRVNSASTANDQAQKALADANNALKSANDQVTKTASEQAKANDALTAAQKSLSDAQAKLTDLQAQLANDEQVLATAKAKAEEAAHKAAKKTELQDQKAAQDAQDALTNAQKAVKNAQDQLASAKDAQTKAANKLAQLKQTASDVKNAQKALNDAQAKLSADQASLTKAQTALKKAKDDAKSANDALTAAKNALTQINSKLAHDQKTLADAQEAAKTDAQRYADDIQIGDISIKPGDHHDLKPSISNPQASADGSITLPGQAGLKALPFGTTAKWHDADKVAADAAHDGNYQEDVDITFPDGSTMTAKANLLVVTPSAPVQGHSNSDKPATPSAPVQGHSNSDKPATPSAPVQGHSNSDKPATPGEKHNGTTSTSNVKIGKNGQLVVINNDATNTASAMPTREAYQTVQANKSNSNSKTAGLPQTGDSHEAGILAALGMVTGLAGLFGLRKKQD